MPGVLPRCVSDELGAGVDGDDAEEGADGAEPGELLVCAKAGAASRVVAKR